MDGLEDAKKGGKRHGISSGATQSKMNVKEYQMVEREIFEWMDDGYSRLVVSNIRR